MDRWTASTLRTLGIVLLGGVILVVTLILLLLSMCAWSGGFGGGAHPDEGRQYLITAVVVLAGGIWLEAWLTRGMIRAAATASALEAASGTAQPSLSESLHLSPRSSALIWQLRLAMGAQIGLSFATSAFGWFWNITRYGGIQLGAPYVLALLLFVPFVLQHVPYAILIYRLRAIADRKSLAYSLVIPCIAVLNAFFGLSTFVRLSVAGREPISFLLIAVPWLIHIAVLVLAWKAIQQTGLHPEPPLLLRAAGVVIAYYFFTGIAIPLVAMLARR